MIAHPKIFFDNTPRESSMAIKWSSLAKFLLKWAPGIVEAIFKVKAQQDAAKPPVQQPPAQPKDTSGI